MMQRGYCFIIMIGLVMITITDCLLNSRMTCIMDTSQYDIQTSTICFIPRIMPKAGKSFFFDLLTEHDN
jgi:hypothetical protein